MRYGIMIGSDRLPRSVDDITGLVVKAEQAGFSSAWMANILGHDAIMSMALAGAKTSKIILGTAVTPTYPRHPAAMAQQAMTAAAASGNRFILGIGLSHKRNMEGLYGYSYDKPARHMREYLNVLMPILNGKVAQFSGDHFNVNGIQLTTPGANTPKVVVAALGPVMLRLTGEMADGTNTWMVGPRTMETHIVKTINDAAQAAGKPAAMIVGNFPVVLTNDVDNAKSKLSEMLSVYGELPSYRAMLDREGYERPEDAALVGDEKTIRASLDRLRDAGVTDFGAAIMNVEDGGFDRTFEFLASLN